MILDEKGNIFDIVDFQKQTINATIDTFVRECEDYLYDNQYNPYGYLDTDNIRAIAKLLKRRINKMNYTQMLRNEIAYYTKKRLYSKTQSVGNALS